MLKVGDQLVYYSGGSSLYRKHHMYCVVEIIKVNKCSYKVKHVSGDISLDIDLKKPVKFHSLHENFSDRLWKGFYSTDEAEDILEYIKKSKMSSLRNDIKYELKYIKDREYFKEVMLELINEEGWIDEKN